MLKWARVGLTAVTILLASGGDIRWVRLSSSRGELPVPSTSREQTGDLVTQLDPDSPAKDIVLSFRVTAPALVWMRKTPSGWDRYVIEKDFLTIEAGGAAYDIDGDGDNDIVFGNDWQGNKLWWWENPYPNFDPHVSWTRHMIKDSGAKQHHDQIFGDFEGLGKPQLVFWNQEAKTLFLARIPSDPRHAGAWPLTVIFSGKAGEGTKGAALYAEGLDAYDVDGDGRVDLLAGNYWFKYEGDRKFRPIQVGEMGGRIRAAKFKPGKYPQIVIAPGDDSGPLEIYECKGDPEKSEDWIGRPLLDRELIHGHTLDIGDVDGDGHLDILAAEQAKWTRAITPIDNPDASAFILYGNGQGAFRTTMLDRGEGWHDSRIADLDGDGDMDLLQKPYAWSAPRVDVWLNNGTGKVKPWRPRVADTVRVQSFRQPVGMELWTYRRELKRDLPGTLRMIRNLGFTDVETASFYNRSASEFRHILDQAGLTCSSLIANYENLNENLDGVIKDAKTLGAHYVLTSSIPHTGALNGDDVTRAAAAFNEWGSRLKAEALQFGYHPHGFEFGHTPDETLFDVLMKQTSPDLVTYEMDVFWFAHAGADPVLFLEKYPDRFAMLHLKDIHKGFATDLTGSAPDDSSVALGTGALDWARILRQAQLSGVKKYYIEDESTDASRQVVESKRFLQEIRF
jgi:sugar phosphate isomerase/epimerase